MRYLIIFMGILLIMISCQETKSNQTNITEFEPLPQDPIPQDTTEIPPDTSIVEPEQIFITDRTGKKWNVTHAVNKYGFKASEFQFGLGPNAIQPINDPNFVQRGENGFPTASNTMQIIGTTINGDSRAYPLNVLNSHEILNDVFGEAHVAVGF